MGFNINAETTVIGCILIAPKLMHLATARLTPECFASPVCRDAFAACLRMSREGSAIDPLTVLSAIGDTPDNRRLLLEYAQGVPSTANFESYAVIVEEAAQRRAATAAAYDLMEALQAVGQTVPLDECAVKASAVLQALESKAQSHALNAKQLYADFLKRMDEPSRYFTTGISRLDKGARITPGSYVIIGGRPSSGKTAITLQFMAHMARDHRVGYYSIETSPEAIYDRLIANGAGVPLERIKCHTLTGEDREAARLAQETMGELDFYVVSAAGWTANKVRAHAVQSKAEIIFIDYVGLIKPASSTAQRYEAVTQISIDLHIAAQFTGIAVVALSQLNRAAGQGADMSSLRESGQLEQDADVVMLIEERKPDGASPATHVVNVAKCKDGKRGKVSLVFDGGYQRFREVDTNHDVPPLPSPPPASQADFEEIGAGDYPW